MYDVSSWLAQWLADAQILSCVLLVAALVVVLALRQPARRTAVARATLVALGALAGLCALPGWSAVHLLAAKPQAGRSAVVERVELAPIKQSVNQLIPTIDVDRISPDELPRETVLASLADVEAPRTSSFDWRLAVVVGQAIGSAVVIGWLVVGAMFARRLRRRAQPAATELQELLKATANGASAAELLSSAEIETPVALGWRRPAIILPADLTRAAHGDIGSMLAHEWAHIANGDLRTLAGSRVLLALFWPQPLYWALRRVIRADQETLADAAAAERTGRLDYAEQLMDWARGGRPRGRAPRLAGAVGLWEGPSQLKRRIAALLDEKLTVLRECSRRWRIGSALVALLAAGLLSLVTLQRQQAAAQEDAAAAAADEAAEESATTNDFVAAAEPADGDVPGAADDEGAVTERKPEHFVRIVVGPEFITFEGQKTTWDALPAILETVKPREAMVLEVAIASNDMSVRQAEEAQARAGMLARQFGFLYSSYIGVHPLGSKGPEATAAGPSPAEQLVRRWCDLVLAGKLDEADQLADEDRKEYAHEVREERYLRDLVFAQKHFRGSAALLVSMPRTDADGREGAVVFRVFRNFRGDAGREWYLRDADFVLPDELTVQVEAFTAPVLVDEVVERTLKAGDAIDLDSGRVLTLPRDVDRQTDDPLKYISLRGLDAMCAAPGGGALALTAVARMRPVDSALWDDRDRRSVDEALRNVSLKSHQFLATKDFQELPAVFAFETAPWPTGNNPRGLLQVTAVDAAAQSIRIRYWLAPAAR